MKANKKKKPIVIPKRNGAIPVIKEPDRQNNSIVEDNRQNALSSSATSSKENTLNVSVPNINGPIETKLQNHSHICEKHLAVAQENKVRRTT